MAAQLQRDLQGTSNETKHVILINGNMCCRRDVRSVLSIAGAHCSGVMSAEGLLADPALFSLGDLNSAPCEQDEEEVVKDKDKDKDKDKKSDLCLPVWFSTFATSPSASLSFTNPPDRSELFLEYCRLSDEYGAAGGWSALEKAEQRYFGDHSSASTETSCSIESSSHHNNTNQSSHHNDTNHSSNSNSNSNINSSSNNEKEAKQLTVARQHLAYMLQKSGHGRSVRFRHTGAHAKHAHLWTRVQGARSLDDLRGVAVECLRGVHSSDPYEER